MKLGLLFFFVLVAIGLVMIWRSHPIVIEVKKDTIVLRHKDCSVTLPVHVEQKSHDLLDELSIERKIVKLPNGQKVVIEKDELPLRHKFGVAYNELLEEIFAKKAKKYFSTDGLAVYDMGEFYVALFYKSRAALVLLYPLDESLVKSLRKCIETGEFTLPKVFDQKPLIQTHWSIKQIILDGLIEKNI